MRTLQLSKIIFFLSFTWGVFFAGGSFAQNSISEHQGEQLLRILQNLGMAGFRNSEEAAFHLADLSIGYLNDPKQTEKVKEFLKITTPLRKQRDQKVLGQLRGENIPPDGYESAKLLFRFAAAQWIANLLNENFDGDQFEFFSPEGLKSKIPGIDLDLSGYSMEWKEIIPGQWLDLCAEPKIYGRNGFRSFCLAFERGHFDLIGGDFKGGKIDLLNQNIAGKLELKTWAE